MANILKRPMFRRGGSVAYGTGITSGLDTPRARYADGPDEEGVQQEDIGLSEKEQEKINPEILKAAYDIIKQKTLPSKEESLTDFLTSFGASAGDPTELQSVGSALGKTLQRYQAVQQPKIQAANKYGAQAALASLKGMTKNDLLAIQKKAKEAAALGMFGDPKDPESYKRAYTAFARKELGIDASPFLKSKSPADQRYDEILRVKEEARKEGKNLSEPEAIAKAELNIKLRSDPQFEKLVREGRYAGQLSRTFITDLPDGSLTLKSNDPNKQVPKPELNKYKAGQIVFDPLTKNFYMYDGKGTFTLRPDITL